MAKILGNLNYALAIGAALLLLVMFAFHGDQMDANYLNWWLRYAHVLVGIVWIGLLYYFNLVQIPTMPKVPAELKPGVTKHIAPEALFWFRWAALATVVTGLAIAVVPPNQYLGEALTLQPGYKVIGVGIYLALIMAFNVWFVIWPSQKVALGIVDGTAEAKAAAGSRAMQFSRLNFILSIPMLYAMVTQFYLPR